MGKGQPPKLCMPANGRKAFDYEYFDCIIKQYAQQNTYGHRVMVLTKNRDGNKAQKYKVEYKGVTYLVHTQNPYIPLIYFTPSTNNNYNYFYMLTKTHDQSTYVGEHFTFGYKLLEGNDDRELDIHFTSYATGSMSPCYLFYKFNENMPKHFMTEQVCSKSNRCDSSIQDLQNRCWFFSTLINLVEPVHDMLTTKGIQPIPMYGGNVTNADPGQFQDKNLDEKFAIIFDTIKNIDLIEIHLIKANYGILHAFKNGEVMNENSKIYTFGFFLDQSDNVRLTSIDVIVAGLFKGVANIYPDSIPLDHLEKVTENDIDKLNLPTQDVFRQILPTNINNIKPTHMQQQKQMIRVSGGRKKKENIVSRTSENRKKKV